MVPLYRCWEWEVAMTTLELHIVHLQRSVKASFCVVKKWSRGMI